MEINPHTQHSMKEIKYKLKIDTFTKHNGNYGYKDIAPNTYISINASSFFDLIKGVFVVAWYIVKERFIN